MPRPLHRVALLLALVACNGDAGGERCEDPLVVRYADHAPSAFGPLADRGVALVDGDSLALLDGDTWTTHPLAPEIQPLALVAGAADDVHLITPGAILHHDGDALAPITVAGLTDDLHPAALARDGDDVWVVGHTTPPGCPAPCPNPAPMVLRVHGGVGEAITSAGLPPMLAHVDAADGALYVLATKGLLRLVDGAWETFDVDAAALHVVSADEVLLIDFAGALLRFDGERADPIAPPADEPAAGYSWRSVTGFGPEALLVGTNAEGDGAAFVLAGDRLRLLLDTTPSSPLAALAHREGGFLWAQARDGANELWGFRCPAE